MFSQIETPAAPRPTLRQVLRALGTTNLANGLIGFIFAATGPFAIILSVGTRGGLTSAELASWVFGVFFINGLISIALSWRYQIPLAFGWTIPGTVLVGPALQHLPFSAVIAAFYATSLLILLLGLSGWVKRLMSLLPMPIVMGMVAGVFLRFGLDVVRALDTDAAIAAPMVLVFFLCSALPALGRRLPPVIAALLVGGLMIALLGRLNAADLGALGFAQPVLQAPTWSWSAMLELVVPLTITVLVVQNGQGVAVLKAAGHVPPVTLIAVACGVGSALSATVGAVSTCLTGPTNALLTSSGDKARHYTGGLVFGCLALVFGVLAPTFTSLTLATPQAFIMVLAGLAMLRALQSAFVSSFGSGKFTLGALISLLVTVADVSLLNIGSAFWGLVAGFVVSWLMERDDFKTQEQ